MPHRGVQPQLGLWGLSTGLGDLRASLIIADLGDAILNSGRFGLALPGIQSDSGPVVWLPHQQISCKTPFLAMGLTRAPGMSDCSMCFAMAANSRLTREGSKRGFLPELMT